MDQIAAQPIAVRRTLSGVVARPPRAGTAAVRVDRVMTHPKYKRQYVRSRAYLAAVGNLTVQAGDRVSLQETRPMGARKRWRVVSVERSAARSS